MILCVREVCKILNKETVKGWRGNTWGGKWHNRHTRLVNCLFAQCACLAIWLTTKVHSKHPMYSAHSVTQCQASHYCCKLKNSIYLGYVKSWIWNINKILNSPYIFSERGKLILKNKKKNAAQSEFYCFHISTDQDTIDFNKMLFWSLVHLGQITVYELTVHWKIHWE